MLIIVRVTNYFYTIALFLKLNRPSKFFFFRKFIVLLCSVQNINKWNCPTIIACNVIYTHSLKKKWHTLIQFIVLAFLNNGDMRDENAVQYYFSLHCTLLFLYQARKSIQCVWWPHVQIQETFLNGKWGCPMGNFVFQGLRPISEI